MENTCKSCRQFIINMKLVEVSTMTKESIFTTILRADTTLTDEIRNQLVKALLEREELGDTCIAPGIVLSHVQCKQCQTFFLGAGLIQQTVPFWNEETGNCGIRVVLLLLIPHRFPESEAKVVIQPLMKILSKELVTKKLSEVCAVKEIKSILLEQIDLIENK